MAFLFIVLFWFADSYAETPPQANPQPLVLSQDVKWQLSVLKDQMGQIIERKKAPALYQLVDLVFERPAKTLEKRLVANYVPINHIFIVDSPKVNAFVFSPKATGVRLTNNLVFVTTAMLNKLLESSDERLAVLYPQLPASERRYAETKEGLKRLTGILVHELSHPLDQLASEGRGGPHLSIADTYGMAGNQGLELSTDIEGSVIARESNLPEDSVYRAHLATLNMNQTQSNLDEALSSHPNDALRVSTMRLYLTVSRLRQGANWDEVPLRPEELNVPLLFKELEAAKEAKGSFPWEPPRDLKEALDRIVRVGNLKSEYEELEYNRLLIAIDDEIAKLEANGQQVPREMITRVGETFVTLIKRDLLTKTWTAQDRVEKLKDFPESRSLLEKPLHYRALNSLRLYSHPEYLKQVDRMVQALLKRVKPPGGPLNSEEYRQLSYLLPDQEFLQRFAQPWIDVEQKLLTGGGYVETVIPSLDNMHLLFSMYPRLSQTMVDFGSLSSIANAFLLSVSRDYALPFFLTSGNTYSNLYKASQNYRRYISQLQMESRTKPESRATLEMIRQAAQKMWDQRASFALLELIARTTSDSVLINPMQVDWMLLAELLGLDKTQVDNQIAQEVSRLLANESEAEAFVAGIGSLIFAPQGKISQLHRVIKIVDNSREADRPDQDPLPSWYRPQLARDILQLRSLTVSLRQNFSYGITLLRKALLVHETASRDRLYKQFAAGVFSRQAPNLTGDQIPQVIKELDDEFSKAHWIKSQGIGRPLSVIALAEAANESPTLSPAQKKTLLKYLFLRDETISEDANELYFSDYFEWTKYDTQKMNRVLPILKANGLYQNFAELVEAIKQSPHYTPIANIRNGIGIDDGQEADLREYFEFIDRIAPQIQQEVLADRLGFRDVRRYASLLNTPRRLKIRRAYSNTANIQELRDTLVSVAMQAFQSNGRRRASIAFSDMVGFFLDITSTGVSQKTDLFFNQFLLPEIGATEGLTHEWVKGILLTDRLQSQQLRLELSRMVNEPLLAKWEKDGFDNSRLWAFIADLNKMAPQGSLAKDDYLESIGLRLHLRGSPLYAFVEDQKTSNWKRENPAVVRAGSAISSGIAKMTMQKRKALLHYLISPSSYPEGLPVEILEEFIEQSRNELIKKNDNGYEKRKSRDEIDQLARSTARLLKLEVDHYLRDSAPRERIPLIETTLTAGVSAFTKAPDFPFNLTREFLGYEPGGFSEKALTINLRLVPEHEVGPRLAYLLSQAKEEKGTVADIFTLYGAPGKKLAQFSSVFQLFGPKVAEETRHIKNRAPALTLYEMYDQLDQLVPEVSPHLEIEGILGAASIKTVSRVLDRRTGRSVAMYLRDRHIVNQNRTHFDEGRRLLVELVNEGLIKNSKLLHALLEALEPMLNEEIDFELEAKKNQEVAAVLSDYNAKNKSSLGDWTFHAPNPRLDYPLTKQLAFYDVIENAVPFDQLSDQLKNEVGPKIVRLTLAMLFRYRKFNPDAHMGNFLIRPDTKEIYFLDAGQLEDFSVDEHGDPMKAVFGLLMAIDQKNPKLIYDNMALMVEPQSAVGAYGPELEQEIRQALAKSDLDQVLVDLLTSFVESGFQFQRRFLFGLGKGQIMLFGEHYVPASQYMEILKAEAMTGFMQQMMAPVASPPTSPVSGVAGNCESELGQQ